MRLSSAIAAASPMESKPCSSFCKVTRSNFRAPSEGRNSNSCVDALRN